MSESGGRAPAEEVVLGKDTEVVGMAFLGADLAWNLGATDGALVVGGGLGKGEVTEGAS